MCRFVEVELREIDKLYFFFFLDIVPNDKALESRIDQQLYAEYNHIYIYIKAEFFLRMT
jgi:hypothetical protein